MNKTCTKCKQIKPLTMFCKGSGFKDNHNNWCKDCMREYRREWYKYNKSKRQKTQRKAWRVYKEKNPEKHKCRWTVWNNLQSGYIIRPSACNRCGISCIPEGHHEDYSKPFDIEWLCRNCHVKLHNDRKDFITNEAK